jgi:hypothetical protein
MRSYLTAVPPRVRTGIRRPWRCWSPSVAVLVAAVVYALLPQSLLGARFAIPIIELAQEVRVGPNICRLPLVSLTNSSAFSPTDTMPLTSRPKPITLVIHTCIGPSSNEPPDVLGTTSLAISKPSWQR